MTGLFKPPLLLEAGLVEDIFLFKNIGKKEYDIEKIMTYVWEKYTFFHFSDRIKLRL